MKKPGAAPGRPGPYRHSRQRERILQLLHSTGSHPTANWLFGRLRKEFPRLSMGTVYRNIGILIEQGRLSRIAFGSTFDRLDANMEPHYHFLCEQCDTILDLDLPVNPSIDGWIGRNQGFVVHSHELEFHGLCPKCAAKA